jgi:uncharacterized membrane protein
MRSTVFFALSMLIFGTIGALVRLIPMPPGEIALVRGLVGVCFLIPILLAMRQPLTWKTTAKYAPRILLAGIALAGNWICLFEAFKSTTIALATISYYTAPVYVLLLSPVFFRERLTTGKIACVILTFAGMALIAFGHQGPAAGHWRKDDATARDRRGFDFRFHFGRWGVGRQGKEALIALRRRPALPPYGFGRRAGVQHPWLVRRRLGMGSRLFG